MAESNADLSIPLMLRLEKSANIYWQKLTNKLKPKQVQINGPVQKKLNLV